MLGGLGEQWRVKEDRIDILSSQGRGGKKEGGDEEDVFIVMFALSVPSPGSHGGCRCPPRMWSGLAQLRSQQLLTNSDINKQSATLWMAIGGRGVKGNRRGGDVGGGRWKVGEDAGY